MTHKCIKTVCPNTYEDNDPEPYYCPSCKEANKAIAAKIDTLLASRPKKEHRSVIQEYDAAPKGPGGFMVVKL